MVRSRRAQVLTALAAASNGGTSPTSLRANVPKATVVGLFRDLRGITGVRARVSMRVCLCGCGCVNV